MKQIQTVLGPISPNELGTTMMHEHLIWNQDIYQRPIDPNSEEGKFAYSKIVPENMYKIRLSGLHSHRQCAKQTDKDEVAEELAYFKAAGGSAIVDCTCLGLDRDPLVEKYISENELCFHYVFDGFLFLRSLRRKINLPAVAYYD